MNLLIATGFLGSGKTTFIIQIAKEASEKGFKTAILVNEVGETGIDDLFMRQLDLNVWEMLGGCICCTIAASLPETLMKLESDYAPDLVIMEPTGAADPSNIVSALDSFRGKNPIQKYQVALLDPTRIKMLMEVLTPLTTSTIKSSDIVLVNKVDLASDEEIEYSIRIAQEIKPGIEVKVVSAKNGIDPGLLEELFACLS